MSEEDAALFWEVNFGTAPDHKSASADLTLPDRAALTDEEAAPKKMISIGTVPTSETDVSRRTDASATLVNDNQDTKPVESANTVCRWDRTGALADHAHTPRPLCLQATIGTQTDEMNQPRTETLSEDENPTTPTETTIPGPDQSKSIRTGRKGWRRADLETADWPEPELERQPMGYVAFR